MINLVCKNATEAFEVLYETISRVGESTNVDTKAIYNVSIEIQNPIDRDITTPWRKWSKRYAEREWNWYLSANPSVQEIKKFAPIWDKMHNGNNIVNSNYGYQWSRNKQLQKVIEQLQKNPNSRQAWITIYDGKEKENYDFDTPCTLAIGFDIKPNSESVDMTVCMRSNDLVYGFCNDQYCFSKLQEYVAHILNRPVGIYTHFAHDMHIYNNKLNLKSYE